MAGKGKGRRRRKDEWEDESDEDDADWAGDDLDDNDSFDDELSGSDSDELDGADDDDDDAGDGDDDDDEPAMPLKKRFLTQSQPSQGSAAAASQSSSAAASQRHKRGGSASAVRVGSVAEVEAADPSLDEFDDGFDDDLYKDAEDRARLAALPELEREAIIAERYEKRKRLRERWELKQQRRPERAGRRDTSRMDREESIRELRRKRSEASRRDRDAEVHERALKRQRMHEEELREQAEKERQELEARLRRPPPMLQQVQQVQVSRAKLEKYMAEPFFKEWIEGLFVRVVAGNSSSGRVRYRCCTILGVRNRRDAYDLNGKSCFSELILKHGKDTKTFKMKYVSNQFVQQDEYETWVHTMRSHRQEFPTPEAMEKLVKQFRIPKTYVYTKEDVEKLVAKRKARTINVASEKTDTHNMLMSAREQGDAERVAELEARLKELEELSVRKAEERNREIAKLAAVNERAMKANTEDHPGTVTDTRGGGDVDSTVDPFVRRVTRPRKIVVRVGMTDEEEAREKQRKADEEAAEKRRKEEAAEAERKAAEERKHQRELERIKSTTTVASELVNAHDIELDIDLGI